MQLRLLAVYSKVADPTMIPPTLAAALPPGLQLSQHQLDTYQALCDPTFLMVINTAMTGDGKSLAGQLPLLVDNAHSLALYPTNELIRDQYQSVLHAFPRWGHSPTRAALLYGARLDELADEALFGGRSDQLLQLLKNHSLVLSNPDIFHSIMQFNYQKGLAPDWIAGPLRQNFNQLIFDEFHSFDVPQVAAVLTGLLFLYAQQGTYPLKTLFLSATPSTTLLPLLHRAGFEGQIKVIEGTYCYGDTPARAEWRPILHATTLQLIPQPEGGIEGWIANQLETTLLAFFRQHGKGAKAAIIVNSVATAHRLHRQIAEPMQREQRTVRLNTGLTDRQGRAESYAADLLIGTSTIDIGVDFQINLLIFEAGDAATFMQRLGRLGRHDGYTDMLGQRHEFTTFEAYALVPAFVYSRLATVAPNEPVFLSDKEALQRDSLRNAIEQAFPPPARYDRYLADWGRFLPVKVLNALAHPTISAAYANLSQQLKLRYRTLFQTSIGVAAQAAKEQKALFNEACSFRGGSPFDIGIFLPDHSEPLTYDLLWLLANMHLKLLSQEEFCAEATRRGFNPKPFTRGYQIAFLQATNFFNQREPVTINLDQAIGIEWSPTDYGRALVIRGVRIDCSGFEELNRLNRQLLSRSFVSLIYPGIQPRDMQQTTYLPGNFPLYRFEGNGLSGTIAFGRQALILDTVLRYRKPPSLITHDPLFL